MLLNMSSTLPPILLHATSSSTMAWETVARRSSTELRSKLRSTSWDFTPASCSFMSLCSSGHRTPGLYHCAALPCTTLTPQRREQQGTRWAYSSSAFHTEPGKPSSVAPLVQATAEQLTHNGGNGQARESTNRTAEKTGRMSLIPFLSNVTSTRKGSSSQALLTSDDSREKHHHAIPTGKSAKTNNPSRCVRLKALKIHSKRKNR